MIIQVLSLSLSLGCCTGTSCETFLRLNGTCLVLAINISYIYSFSFFFLQMVRFFFIIQQHKNSGFRLTLVDVLEPSLENFVEQTVAC